MARLSIRDPQLPEHVQKTLSILKANGFDEAKINYEIPNSDLPRYRITLADLRLALRTGVAAVSDATGKTMQEATAIVTDVAQDDYTTMFRLLVDLTD